MLPSIGNLEVGRWELNHSGPGYLTIHDGGDMVVTGELCVGIWGPDPTVVSSITMDGGALAHTTAGNTHFGWQGGSGALLMSGASTFTATVGQFFVGCAGLGATGLISMNDSAVLNFTDTTGWGMRFGDDEDFGIGGGCSGSMTMSGLSTVNYTGGGFVLLGQGAGNSGYLSMDTASSFLGNAVGNHHISAVGYDGGSGTILMTGATRYESGEMMVANGPGATGVVSLTDGTIALATGTDWTVEAWYGYEGTLDIGRWGGTGSVEADGSAQITVGGCTLIGNGGDYAGTRSKGSLTLKGMATMTTSQGVMRNYGWIWNDGGTVIVGGAEWERNVNDTGSWGQEGGIGTLTIQDNAQLNVPAANVHIGMHSGTGTLDMSGSGAIVTGGRLFVGYVAGVGTVNMSGDSSIATSNGIDIASVQGAQGTMTMRDSSKITVAGELRVGDAWWGDVATGRFDVRDFASVTVNGCLNAGNNGGGVGVINIGGTATGSAEIPTVNAYCMHFGDGGNGTFNVYGLSTVVDSGWFNMGCWNGGTGVLNMHDASTFTVTNAGPSTGWHGIGVQNGAGTVNLDGTANFSITGSDYSLFVGGNQWDGAEGTAQGNINVAGNAKFSVFNEILAAHIWGGTTGNKNCYATIDVGETGTVEGAQLTVANGPNSDTYTFTRDTDGDGVQDTTYTYAQHARATVNVHGSGTLKSTAGQANFGSGGADCVTTVNGDNPAAPATISSTGWMSFGRDANSTSTLNTSGYSLLSCGDWLDFGTWGGTSTATIGGNTVVTAVNQISVGTAGGDADVTVTGDANMSSNTLQVGDQNTHSVLTIKGNAQVSTRDWARVGLWGGAGAAAGNTLNVIENSTLTVAGRMFVGWQWGGNAVTERGNDVVNVDGPPGTPDAYVYANYVRTGPTDVDGSIVIGSRAGRGTWNQLGGLTVAVDRVVLGQYDMDQWPEGTTVQGGSSDATLNLKGGEFRAPQFMTMSGTTSWTDPGTSVTYPVFGGSATGTVNFDGGMLTVTGSTSNLFATDGLASYVNLNVQNGGAKINVGTNAVTINQPMVASGTGGVVKSGLGTLTLNGANTYAGQTVLKEGVLSLATAAQATVLTLGGADVRKGILQLTYATPSDNPVVAANDAVNTGLITSTTAPGDGLTLGTYDDGAGTVSIARTFYGDFNLDGSVDGVDLDIWKAYAGTSGPGTLWQMGDANHDWSVDGLDQDLWKLYAGSSMTIGDVASAAPRGAAGHAVPEPGTFALLLLALVGFGVYRRRSK